MAPHSSTLAWKISWTEEPGGLQSMGALRVGHDWATSLSLFTFHFDALEKEMATHSSVLAWRSPGMGEPGGLPSMGSHRIRHDWSDLAGLKTKQCIPLTLLLTCMQTALSVNVLTISCECKSCSTIDKIRDKSWDCSAFAGALANQGQICLLLQVFLDFLLLHSNPL